MKIRIIFGLMIMGTLGLVAHAQDFSIVVSEAEVTAQTGEASWDPEGICVAPNGTIYVVDSVTAGNDRIIKVVPGSPNTVSVLTTEDDIVAAIDAVNGTGGYTDFSFAGQGVAADGDLILVNGDSGSAESVVAVDQTSGAITVIYTPIDGAASDIEGVVSGTVIGNTVYMGRFRTYGASEHDVVAINTNDAAAPSAVVTQLVSESAITAANGAVDNMSSLGNDGTNLIGTCSGSSGSTDNIFQITTGGTITLHVAATDIEADLPDTDIGVAGLAGDNAGRIWFHQAFGGATYNNGVVMVANAGSGIGDASGFTEAGIIAQLGITSLGVQSGQGSVAYDRFNHRVLFTTGTYGSDNIVFAANVGAILDVEDWQEY